MIYLNPPHLTGNETQYTQQACASGWITSSGFFCDEFKKKLEEYTTKKIILTNSGTAALHTAIKNLTAKEAGIIFVPTHSFVASANPIIYEGYTPFFIDSDINTGNMDMNLLEQSIQYCIKNNWDIAAIIIVHIYGYPAPMNELIQIAEKYQIEIIEDAAEAMGSTYYWQPCGTIAKQGIYSFNGNKIITTSGGGALITKEDAYYENGLLYTNQYKNPSSIAYEHSKIGNNYRLSNISAAIGLGQLEQITSKISFKKQLYSIYQREFKKYSFIKTLQLNKNCESNHWLSTFIIDHPNFDSVIFSKYMLQLKIEVRPFWKPLHRQPFLEKYPKQCNGNTEKLFKKGICFPSGTQLNDNQIDYIIEKTNSYLKNL